MNLPLLRHTIISAKRQLQEARDYKASLEIKALLPPAGCSQPELYGIELQPAIERASTVIASFEAILADLENDLADELAKPVQLELSAS